MPAPRDDQTLQITLLQERSTGTFARVYLAEARGGGGLSRVVAVKVIKEQWSDSHEILTRTRDEARLLARLQHKNILRVEALAEVDGQPAIVMEFVDGLDLQQLIERLTASARRIPRRALYKIMADATSAVAAAWEEVPLGGSEPLRVVHRDLKPSNVMVSRQGEVKVLDFGTARFDITDRQARTGALRFGSLKYMSPERRQGDRGEHASDVYALGLLCVEMLRGEMLPILPLEPLEHDAWLSDLIERQGDLGLPDARWDDALRQTLRAMVHSDPGQRLHASQLIPLFRAFSDNATGASLDAFAAETVSPLAGSVHGGQPGGSMAGSRVFVAMTTSSDIPVPSSSPRNLALASPPEITAVELPDDEPPTMVSALAAPAPQRSGPLPVQAAPVADAPAAPFPAEDSVTRLASQPVAPSTGAAAPATAAPRSAPSPARAQAAARPAAGNPAASSSAGGRSNLVAGLIAGLVVFLIGGLLLVIVGVGVGAWLYWKQAPSELPVSGLDPALAAAAGDDAPQPEAGPEAAPQAAAPAVQVEIVADDELLQWIAIEDPTGARVFKGSPGGTTSLAPGAYTLLAKVRARGAVQQPWTLQAATRLRCASAEKGAVRCEPDQGAALVLGP